MKVGSGIKVRVDKSSGIEIGMADVFAKNQPKTPLQICQTDLVYYETIKRELNKRLIGTT
jgi:hypothetical protein